jgi:hypothetical protein
MAQADHPSIINARVRCCDFHTAIIANDDENGLKQSDLNSILLILVEDVAVIKWLSATSTNNGRERPKWIQ